MFSKLYLLLGSNLGNRKTYLKKAFLEIQEIIGEIITSSSYYESMPWGYNSSNKYINQLVIVHTKLNPFLVLKKIHEIENKLGRIRLNTMEYTDRCIDIDILFYNSLIVNHPKLVIPHPKIPDRRFTLTLLCELEPELVHPLLKKNMRSLLNECKDNTCVLKLSN